MITGFPLGPEVSFFSRLVKAVAAERPVEAEVVSLAGFPIYRARGHLAKQVLRHKPDYVVVQFGTTDAIAALQRYLAERLRKGRKAKQHKGLVDPEKSHISSRGANPVDVIRWSMKALLARWLRVPPRTSLEVYKQSLSAIATEIMASGAHPIVLTPFRFGDQWSAHYGEQFAAAAEELASSLGFVVINGPEVLRPYPLQKILLANGYHLSAFGHEVIAQELLKRFSELESKERLSSQGCGEGCRRNSPR